VTGQVVSAEAGNAPVAGATVSTTVGTTTSANDGSFTVPAPADDRSVIHVEANGFAEAFPVTRVVSGQTTTIGVKLLPVGVTMAVNVANGGTVTVPNSTAQVELPANGLVPQNGGPSAGTVNVSVTPINPAVDPNLMPGDFTGLSAGGTTPIESFGAIVVDLRDNAGNRYNLAAGKTSTIRIPLGTQNPNPPATIPLWYFDETTGLWVEEGTATLQGTAPDQYYEGTVTHFSAWNADDRLLRTWVEGCVRDANGQPVVGVLVEARGIDYTGSDSDFTTANGTFRVGVRKGSSASISVTRWSFNPFIYETISNAVTVTSLPNDPVDFVRTLPNCIVVNPGVLTITTSVLAAGNEGAAYSQTLAANGGVPGYVWSLDATSIPLPGNLSLNPSGVISGTPTTAGTTLITVKVTDSVGGIATKQLSLTINPAGVVPIAITTLALPGGTVGSVYSTTVVASGGTGTLSWSVVSGALPTSMTLNPSTGVISGTPTTAGTSTFTIQVQDSSSPQQVDQKEFNLTVNSASSGGPFGSLTITGGPSSLEGSFVPTEAIVNSVPQIFRERNPGGSVEESMEIVWDQSGVFGVTFYNSIFTVGQFGIWSCRSEAGSTNPCSSVSLNRTGGTLSFVNTVLPSSVTLGSPIILNGTLNFTPF